MTDWWYYIWIKPISLFILGGICTVASIILVWSETTFQITSVSLSIPGLMIQNIESPFIVEVIIFISLSDYIYGFYIIYVRMYIFYAL